MKLSLFFFCQQKSASDLRALYFIKSSDKSNFLPMSHFFFLVLPFFHIFVFFFLFFLHLIHRCLTTTVYMTREMTTEEVKEEEEDEDKENKEEEKMTRIGKKNPLLPTVLWAQRRDRIFLTFEIKNAISRIDQIGGTKSVPVGSDGGGGRQRSGVGVRWNERGCVFVREFGCVRRRRRREGRDFDDRRLFDGNSRGEVEKTGVWRRRRRRRRS